MNKGVSVVNPSLENIKESFQVRAHLENNKGGKAGFEMKKHLESSMRGIDLKRILPDDYLTV